jgi:hypothetical protein
MTTPLFLIAMVAAASGQPFIACLIALAAVACVGRRKLN